MKKYYEFTALLVFVIIILISSVSCGTSINQEEYDSLLNDFNDAEEQLEALQLKLAETVTIEALYEDLKTQFEELKEQITDGSESSASILIQYEDLSTRFKELEKQNDINLNNLDTIQSQYNELKTLYDEIVAQAGPFTTGDVEAAIFDLINQTRTDNGLEELLPGPYIYDDAETNNKAMVAAREITYSPEAGWQEILWAAGYDSADAISNAALIIWKSNIYRFEASVLNPQAIYGAVSAYKSGDIIYITYISHTFK